MLERIPSRFVKEPGSSDASQSAAPGSGLNPERRAVRNERSVRLVLRLGNRFPMLGSQYTTAAEAQRPGEVTLHKTRDIDAHVKHINCGILL